MIHLFDGIHAAFLVFLPTAAGTWGISAYLGHMMYLPFVPIQTDTEPVLEFKHLIILHDLLNTG